MSVERTGRPDDWIVYERTEKGTQEIQERKFKLSQELRTCLILVDGQTAKGALLNQFTKLAVAESLAKLEQQGFIVRKSDVIAPVQIGSVYGSDNGRMKISRERLQWAAIYLGSYIAFLLLFSILTGLLPKSVDDLFGVVILFAFGPLYVLPSNVSLAIIVLGVLFCASLNLGFIFFGAIKRSKSLYAAYLLYLLIQLLMPLLIHGPNVYRTYINRR